MTKKTNEPVRHHVRMLTDYNRLLKKVTRYRAPVTACGFDWHLRTRTTNVWKQVTCQRCLQAREG